MECDKCDFDLEVTGIGNYCQSYYHRKYHDFTDFIYPDKQMDPQATNIPQSLDTLRNEIYDLCAEVKELRSAVDELRQDIAKIAKQLLQ